MTKRELKLDGFYGETDPGKLRETWLIFNSCVGYLAMPMILSWCPRGRRNARHRLSLGIIAKPDIQHEIILTLT